MEPDDRAMGAEQGTPDDEGMAMRAPGADGMSRRVLEFFWLVDCSGSMQGRKIDALNTAVRECIPAIGRARDAAKGKPPVMMRAIRFSAGAAWHIAKASDVADFEWVDLKDPGGCTDLGKALELLAPELSADRLPKRGLRPAIVLVSDGMPTDDWRRGLAALLAEEGGRRSVRAAVGISGGAGDEPDMGVLAEFTGNDPEYPPILANNAVDLARYIRWVSTVLVKDCSSPPAGPGAAANRGPGAAGQPKPTPQEDLKPKDIF